jgi:hypothetical protein
MYKLAKPHMKILSDMKSLIRRVSSSIYYRTIIQFLSYAEVQLHNHYQNYHVFIHSPRLTLSMHLVNTSTTTISAVHPPCTRSLSGSNQYISHTHRVSSVYLQSRLARQRTPQLHQRSRDFVAYSSMTFMMVNDTSSGSSSGVVTTSRSCGPGGCGGGCGSCTCGATRCCALGAEDLGLQTGTCG